VKNLAIKHDPVVDLETQIAACAKARAVFDNAKRLRSERPDRMRAAKNKLAEAEHARDALQAQADAGGDVDFNRLAMLDAQCKSAQAELDANVRSAHADGVAIEALRSRLSDVHAALNEAMRPQVERARLLAQSKYAAGLQSIRDAVVIIGKLDDEMVPVRFTVPDIEYGSQAFSRVRPSPDVVDLLLAIDPAVRERDTALRAAMR
jgi:hypothetical protein